MRRAILAGVTLAALALSGCKSPISPLTTGSIGSNRVEAAQDSQGWRAIAARWRPIYEATPTDATAAINYGRALRALDQKSQALAVLQTAAIKNPRHMQLLGEYGRALADNGRFDEALDVFPRAHTPDRPDWRILAAQGAVLDQLGRGPEAIKYYNTALKMAPGEPSILSNMGLSYALQSDLTTAETYLRQAYASPKADMRVRLNLALVLALQGRFPDAETIARQDLSKQQAAQNTATLRQMLAQSNNWQKLRQMDGKAQGRG